MQELSPVPDEEDETPIDQSGFDDIGDEDGGPELRFEEEEELIESEASEELALSPAGEEPGPTGELLASEPKIPEPATPEPAPSETTTPEPAPESAPDEITAPEPETAAPPGPAGEESGPTLELPASEPAIPEPATPETAAGEATTPEPAPESAPDKMTAPEPETAAPQGPAGEKPGPTGELPIPEPATPETEEPILEAVPPADVEPVHITTVIPATRSPGPPEGEPDAEFEELASEAAFQSEPEQTEGLDLPSDTIMEFGFTDDQDQGSSESVVDDLDQTTEKKTKSLQIMSPGLLTAASAFRETVEKPESPSDSINARSRLMEHLSELAEHLPEGKKDEFEKRDMLLRMEALKKKLKGVRGIRKRLAKESVAMRERTPVVGSGSIQKALGYLKGISRLLPNRKIGLVLQTRLSDILGKLRGRSSGEQ